MRFYINKSSLAYKHNEDDITPKHADSFILKHTAWDDYSLECEFKLYYCNEALETSEIGRVKIISKNIEAKLRESLRPKTIDELPDSFPQLPDDFCSLGQFLSYYENLLGIFNGKTHEILEKLKDCTSNPVILEDFSQNCPLSFHRAARRDEAQEALLKARALIQGINLDKIHDFSYIYTPPYKGPETALNIHFGNKIYLKNKHKSFEQRIYALIGKNGTGKTGLLNNLAKALSKEGQGTFIPNAPIFQKTMYISSSCFDNEPDVDKGSRYNYVYSGISKFLGEDVRASIKDTVEKSYDIISRVEREPILIDALERLLPNQILNWIINQDINKVNIAELKKALGHLSSGECIQIMHIFTIIANIFSGTLLLFDEPETHLHPNAISRLISTLNYILEEYNSYAIISTHSPIIIQNLRAKEVIVVERFGNICQFKQLSFESLGCNLSIITEKIFNNDSITPLYQEKIETMKDSGVSKEELISKITETPEEMSLALNMFIDMTYQD